MTKTNNANQGNTTKKDAYFWGHKVSEYGVAHNRVDYATMSKSFDAVLCNNIESVDPYIFDEIISGELNEYYNAEGEEITQDEYLNDENATSQMIDIFQYYIVSDNALQTLQEAGELVLYSNALDCYIWCVTHYGTSWDYVLTNIKIDDNKE